MSATPEQLEKTDVEPERPAEQLSPRPRTGAPAPPHTEELVVEDLLVEDVSIDGMCGVY